VAEAAKAEAVDARDLAKLYRDDAAAHAANLQATRTAVASDRETTQLARDEAVDARDDAVVAKSDTLVARSEAVSARDQAEQFAASINPATLATKADLSTEVARIVGQSPETMNALDELAAALGNDPNFATTITNQIASKAALVHTHGLADIIGLQTALDGKQPVGSYVTSAGFTWANLGGKPTTFTPSAHTHAIGDVTGLQSALDAKQPAGSYAPANHQHVFIAIEDTRSGYRTPNDSMYQSVTAEFTNQIPGLSDWRSLLNVKGWTSGYRSWQLIGPSSTTESEDLYFRTGNNTTWGSPRKVWHEGNFNATNAVQYSSGADIRIAGQIRATGWYSSERGNIEGMGVEMGVSSGTGYIYGYNRSSAAYGPLNIKGSTIRLDSETSVNGFLSATRMTATGGFNFINTDYAESGVPWYGMGFGAGQVVHLTGYYGVQIRSESAIVKLRSPQGMHVQAANGDSRGYLWHDTSGFGLLDSVGNWKLQVTTGGVNLYGAAYAQSSLDVLGTFTPRKGLRPYGVGTDSGAVPELYTWGYQQAGPWAHPYPDLIIGYYTGIKIGGSVSYGGTRFYGDHPDAAGAQELMSVGNTDGHVRVTNSLFVGTELFLKGNTAQPIRPSRLYRRDDASAYSLQHHWTGTHWYLRGYAEETFHAECRVGYADSAGNAATLGGYAVAEGAGSSTIPVRTGAGYLNAVYFHQGSPNNENSTVSQVFVCNGNDGYLRKAGIDHLANNVAQQPGHRRTISTAAPSGGSSGDLWFKV